MYLFLVFGFFLTMVCQHVEAEEIVLQPGPGEGKDIWTTSVYSHAPGGGGPGGGLDNEWLQVGGWGDLYYTLIAFDLNGFPTVAQSARIELFVGQNKGYGTTGMYLDRINEFWDWRIQGTGSDYERLWWVDRPSATQWIPGSLPEPTVGQWYSIDITDLYNAWQDGTYPNYGLQLRPTSVSNQWNEFYSADYLVDPTLRPKLVIEAESTFTLMFPINGYTADTTYISSIFDHSNSPYVKDGTIVSDFGGNGHCSLGIEVYNTNNGVSTELYGKRAEKLCEKIIAGQIKKDGKVYSYKKDNYLPTNYPPFSEYLSYDGHSGYDFPYPGGTSIIAPENGVLCLATSETSNENTSEWRDATRCPYELDKINGNNNKKDPWSGFHTFYIIHESSDGYSTWFLHADQLDNIIANTIALQGFADVGKGDPIAVVGNYGLCSQSDKCNHLHFEVRQGAEILVDPYGWNGEPVLWE